MKAQLSIPKNMFPKSKAFQGALERGALARFDNKQPYHNPYDILRSTAYWNHWNRGWIAADTGDIKVE